MNKKGFIATSLIYSFFLAFISIVAVLLSAFIANKTILDRFNGKVQDDLNTSTFVVTVYARNANIKDGRTMTNLLSNGDFSQNLDFWKTEGKADYSTTLWLGNYSVLKNNNNVSNSFLYQNIYVMNNNIYYMSLDYLHDASSSLYAYMGEKTDQAMVLKDNQGKIWTRNAVSYRSSFDGNTMVVIGDSGNISYRGNSYFTNAIVLNLTASFGKGKEPDLIWVQNNVAWFDGTISYYRQAEIEFGGEMSLEFTPYAGYDNYSVSCMDEEGKVISSYSMSSSIETEDEDDERKTRMFDLVDIKSNIKCNVEWGE